MESKSRQGGVRMVKPTGIQNWLVANKKCRDFELRLEILIRLLNAIRSARRRGTKTSRMYIFREKQKSPLQDDSRLSSRLKEATEWAISEAQKLVFEPRRVNLRIEPKFSWDSDLPGDVNAGPGVRALCVVTSSVTAMSKDTLKKVTGKEWSERRCRVNREGAPRKRKGVIGKGRRK